MSNLRSENNFVENSLPKLFYDPVKRRSNIYELEPLLDCFVQQNYNILSDCISAKSLRPILPPNIAEYVPGLAPAPIQADEDEADEDEVETVNGEEVAEEDDEVLFSDEEDEQVIQPQPGMPIEFAMKRYEIDYSNYVERNQQRSDELSKLFGLLKSITSSDSRNKIKSHPHYTTAKKDRNGFALWKIMFSTHQVSNSYLSEPQQRAEAERRYHSFFQHSSTSLSEYHTSFKSNLRAMREVKCHLPKMKEAAATFINGLCDERYGELKNQLANAIHFNMMQPIDIQAAYALASNYVVYQQYQRPAHKDRTVMYAEKGKEKPRSNFKYPHSNHSIGEPKSSYSGKSHSSGPQRKPSSNQHSSSGPQRTSSSNQHSSSNRINHLPHTTPNPTMCRYCGKQNHTEENCFKKQRDKKVANTDLIEVGLPDLGTNLEYDINMVYE